MQITKLESSELDVIVIYRSQQANLTELTEHLMDMITPGITTVVCGDLNICYLSNKNNRITKSLEENGFSQLLKEATHIKGRHIDHFYYKLGEKIAKDPSLYRYSPYYSDHDSICATIFQTEE